MISSLFKKFASFYHPERFQGWGKTRQYFEGWYFKVVDPTNDLAYAFIPGVSMDKHGQKHAFIQVLNGIKKTSEYHRFPFDAFSADHKQFALAIGDNTFDERGLHLSLPGISGDLSFSAFHPWPVSLFSPGIMGPYAFVPRMECYHGIVSMDHKVEGWLEAEGQRVALSEGRGYIEKDWGHSFPSAYFWMQSNHFSHKGTSFKCSVAKIPWMGSSFVGFIAGLWHDGQLIQFTTYNGTQLKRSTADMDLVEIILTNKKYQLTVKADRSGASELASPISGAMTGKIEESMKGVLHVELKDRKTDETVFSDSGHWAGLEVAGKIEEIMV